jgi:hypothetical protein
MLADQSLDLSSWALGYFNRLEGQRWQQGSSNTPPFLGQKVECCTGVALHAKAGEKQAAASL